MDASQLLARFRLLQAPARGPFATARGYEPTGLTPHRGQLSGWAAGRHTPSRCSPHRWSTTVRAVRIAPRAQRSEAVGTFAHRWFLWERHPARPRSTAAVPSWGVQVTGCAKPFATPGSRRMTHSSQTPSHAGPGRPDRIDRRSARVEADSSTSWRVLRAR